MLIKKIEVTNFRKLTGPLAVGQFQPGLNILAGNNEEGKSTLLQAIKAAFCQKYNSASQQVRSYLPYGCAVRPEVAVEFELNGGNYKLSKGFCLKATAELRTPGAVYQGPEAEEKLQELLHPGEAHAGDGGLFALLWVDQTDAERGLKPSESARTGLMKVLESNLSTIGGGEDGRALQMSVEKKYLEYFTPTGREKEKGPLKEARAINDRLAQQLDECNTRYELYRKRLTELAEKQERQSQYERERVLEKAESELARLVKAVQELAHKKLELESARAKEKTARLEHEQAQAGLKARIELKELIAKLQKEVDENKSAQATHSDNIGETQSVLAATEKTQGEIEAELKRCMQLCQQLEQIELRERLATGLTTAQKQVESLNELEATIAALTLKASALAVDDSAIAAVRKAQQAKNDADIRLAAVTTKVTLRPDRGKTASIDGTEVPVAEPLQLTEPAVVKLDGWGEIEIVPGGEALSDLAKTAEKKAKELAGCLKKAGAATVQAAESQLAERKRYENEIEQAKAKIAGITRGAASKVIRDQLARLKTDMQELPDAAPDAVTAEGTSLADERERQHALAQGEKEARDAVQAARAALSKLEIEGAILATALTTAAQRLAQAQNELAAISSSEADEARLVAQKEHIWLTAQSEVRRQELDLATEEPQMIEKRLAQAQKCVDDLKNEIRSLADQVLVLSTEINVTGDAGIGEELERLSGERSQSDAQLKRTERHAAALKLLQDTLAAAEQSVKDQFLSPVVVKARPYLERILPGAQVTLDPTTVEIANLERNGLSEQFFNLSVGTREQVSVVTRIAVAKLVKDSGRASVIMLDDALVHCDDQRFDKMKSILEEVAQTVQIILFTCRPKQYADLASANVIRFDQAVVKLDFSKR